MSQVSGTERITERALDLDRLLQLRLVVARFGEMETSEGKWKARVALARPVEELVQKRTSAAVKTSPKSLVEAAIVGGAGTKRARKARTND